MRFLSALLKSSIVAAILLATFSLSTVAKAAILLDNLGGTLNNSALITPDNRAAVGFTVTSIQNGDWTFTVHAASTEPNGDTLVLQLVSDSSGNPGTTPVFGLSGGFTSDDGIYNVYTFSGNGQLNPSTTYWLVASTSSGIDEYDWVSRGTYTESGATFQAVQLHDGNAWADGGTLVKPALQIDVTPVPEPAQTGAIAALFLIACSLAHTYRRRRLAAKATTQS